VIADDVRPAITVGAREILPRASRVRTSVGP
jgi:hypothetical protein